MLNCFDKLASDCTKFIEWWRVSDSLACSIESGKSAMQETMKGFERGNILYIKYIADLITNDVLVLWLCQVRQTPGLLGGETISCVDLSAK